MNKTCKHWPQRWDVTCPHGEYLCTILTLATNMKVSLRTVHDREQSYHLWKGGGWSLCFSPFSVLDFRRQYSRRSKRNKEPGRVGELVDGRRLRPSVWVRQRLCTVLYVGKGKQRVTGLPESQSTLATSSMVWVTTVGIDTDWSHWTKRMRCDITILAQAVLASPMASCGALLVERKCCL